MKSTFFANISHEFRTPLTVISGSASQIKGNELEKKLIRRNSKSLLQLVNQLLDLSRLESGVMNFHNIRADIIPYLQSLTESLHTLASDKDVQLLFYPEHHSLEMDFDEEKIQHIIYNLLSNAIKFTNSKGKVVLHARQEQIKNKPWLQLKVSDTGIGIPPEGADAYLTKPFNKEELLVRLNKLIELRDALQVYYTKSDVLFQVTQNKENPSSEDLFLQKLIMVVNDRLDDPKLSVTDLCRAANLSNMQVNRKLKALTGKTPSLFIRSIRLHKGRELLLSTDMNISEIAYDVGFSDPNYFSRTFLEEFGMSPSDMRK